MEADAARVSSSIVMRGGITDPVLDVEDLQGVPGRTFELGRDVRPCVSYSTPWRRRIETYGDEASA